ncbi:MAG: HDOD domain-containing protein [Nitrospinaceae bacterium]
MLISPQEMVKGSVRLSSIPEIFFKINDAVNDPECSFGDVADIINNDTSLSARLLKMVNSSFYNFPSKIDSISHAISIVGTHQLRDLALATMVMTFFRGIPEDFVSMKSFWCHSVGCGITGWVLAIHSRQNQAERFYLAGILHDVGRLIIIENHPDQAKEIIDLRQDNDELLNHVEERVMGFDHGAVGAALTRAWNLPEYLEEMIEFHHKPLEARNHPTETAILNLADGLSKAMELGCSGERLVPPLEPGIWEKVGLPVSLLPSIWDQVQTHFDATIEIFIGDESK